MFNLKIARLRRGLSQKELAEIIGVKNTAISRWESGYNKISTGKLIKLAQVLEVSTDFLLGLSDKM